MPDLGKKVNCWRSNIVLAEVTHAVVRSLQNEAAERFCLAVAQCTAFGCHLQFSLRSISALLHLRVWVTVACLLPPASILGVCSCEPSPCLGCSASFAQPGATSAAVLLLKRQR